MARLGKFFYINGTDNLSNAHFLRVRADGGITESLGCIDTAGTLLESASYFMRPSGFKEDTVYSLIPNNSNGSLNFTRASDAWRTDIEGLIQRVPWNLCTYSEQFQNADWLGGGNGKPTMTDNFAEAPNGTMTASKMEAASDGYQLRQNNAQENTQMNLSVWLRTNTGTKTIQLFMNNASTASQNITVTTTWTRYEISGLVTTLSGGGRNGLNTLEALTSSNYILIWGFQLNVGLTAKPYFPTTDRLNVPRLTYQNGGGGCPAALLEPQRTNLDPNSQTFSGWFLTNSGGTTVTTVSASNPYNFSTVAKVIPDAVLGQHRPFTTINYSAAGRIWVIAKSAGYDYLSFGETGSVAGGSIIFNLSNGTISGSAAGYTGEISSLGGGWYKCSLNIIQTGAFSRFIVVRNANSTADYTGDGTSGVLIAHKQMEVGAYDTTSILTSGATATRVADSFSRSNIYTNGLISASGGTWFVELRGNVAYTRDASTRIGIGDDSTLLTNSLFLNPVFGGGRIYIQKCVSGSIIGLYQTTTNTCKIAIKWNGTSADIFENGVKVVSATSFTATNMEWLTGNAGTPVFIQQMALFNYPLSDSDCQLLTT